MEIELQKDFTITSSGPVFLYIFLMTHHLVFLPLLRMTCSRKAWFAEMFLFNQRCSEATTCGKDTFFFMFSFVV